MAVLLLLLIAPVLAAQTEHRHHPPANASAYARELEDPGREAWQKPDEVVAALRLKPTDVVADIGSGTGYFTRRIAPHAAKVLAVDIDPDLLKLAARNSPANVETIHGTPSDPKLPAASVDLIFFCNVLHHIDNRPAYYEKLKRALKPGGRIVNVDFYKKSTQVGPPPAMKLSEQQVIGELKAAGFRLSRKLDFLPYQYFLEFERE